MKHFTLEQATQINKRKEYLQQCEKSQYRDNKEAVLITPVLNTTNIQIQLQYWAEEEIIDGLSYCGQYSLLCTLY